METRSKQSNYVKPLLVGATVGLFIALTFVSGFFFRDWLGAFGIIQAVASDPTSKGYPLLDEVQGLLDSVYFRTQPDYSARQYAAIRGMLAGLEEPNTFFIEPPVTQSEADVLAGTYGGIGVLVKRNESAEFVLYPFDDSPAARAGIVEGTVLVAVNGIEIPVEAQPDFVDQQLRGEVKDGNGVSLTIMLDNQQQTLFIEFAVINVPSVVWHLLEQNQRIGYTQILRFTARTPEEVDLALNDLLRQDIHALVLDLRDNSGGLLDESIQVASFFLDGGIVIYEVSRDSERTLQAEKGELLSDLPIAVLVNGGTASASELVAGAIRDRGRGIIIGQQTFGKGTVQQIFPLSDGSSVHITSAEWLTPNRTPLAGIGLEPDITMIPDQNGRDVELGEAIRYLETQLIAKESEVP